MRVSKNEDGDSSLCLKASASRGGGSPVPVGQMNITPELHSETCGAVGDAGCSAVKGKVYR